MEALHPRADAVPEMTVSAPRETVRCGPEPKERVGRLRPDTANVALSLEMDPKKLVRVTVTVYDAPSRNWARGMTMRRSEEAARRVVTAAVDAAAPADVLLMAQVTDVHRRPPDPADAAASSTRAPQAPNWEGACRLTSGCTAGNGA
jgi:hypothetical protein